MEILSSSTTNNKLKLLVKHTRKGTGKKPYVLSITEKEEDDGHENCLSFSNQNPCFGSPFASCDQELSLWNPSTEKVIKIPQHPPPSAVYDGYVKFYGFGLDPKTDDHDYKVIRYIEFDKLDDPITDLYSLKTDSWKQIACPDHKNFVVLSSPIYINGFNYWQVSTRNDFAIMSFDFAEECFPCALIPGPPTATYKHGADFPYVFRLAECEGSLAVVHLVKGDLFEIWVWNNQSWTWSIRGQWPIPCVLHPLRHASQQGLGQHLNNNKLKLMVNHALKVKGSRDPHFSHFSLLSISEKESDDDDKSETFRFCDATFGGASCHELVLRLAENESDEDILDLWNPSTNEVIKTLPQPKRPPPSVEYDEFGRFYGLGLVDDDDYKVIRNVNLDFMYEGPRYRSYWDRTELYSLKTDSWKTIACPHHYLTFVVLSHPIYINGFNYWPVSTQNSRFAIMSFDFAAECFPCPLIPGPCAATYNFAKHLYKFLLAEYEGSLAVVVYLVVDKQIDLWVWKNQSWRRRGEWAIPNIAGVSYPLGLYKNDQFYFEDKTGELVLFDCAKQKLKNLGLFVDFGICHMEMFPYYSK